uniref:Uncharacterized protein n=1 Tax=Anguilla anguilla TaxID=7936 RepID=A0A0E9SI48_ANGAN
MQGGPTEAEVFLSGALPQTNTSSAIAQGLASQGRPLQLIYISNSSQMCGTGSRSGLCASQSSSPTPITAKAYLCGPGDILCFCVCLCVCVYVCA